MQLRPSEANALRDLVVRYLQDTDHMATHASRWLKAADLQGRAFQVIVTGSTLETVDRKQRAVACQWFAMGMGNPGARVGAVSI